MKLPNSLAHVLTDVDNNHNIHCGPSPKQTNPSIYACMKVPAGLEVSDGDDKKESLFMTYRLV